MVFQIEDVEVPLYHIRLAFLRIIIRESILQDWVWSPIPTIQSGAGSEDNRWFLL